MTHMIDQTTGRDAIAYRGDVPWHKLGQPILPGDDIPTIQHKAAVDYEVLRSVVQYNAEKVGQTGQTLAVPRTMKDRVVLYRSDTQAPLSVVSDRYQVVQPREILEFYRDLVANWGFEIETVGALSEGRRIWALANTHCSMQLRGRDDLKGFLLLATSYDGTMASIARFVGERVVCHNTITIAINEHFKASQNVTIPHSTKFDPDKIKEALQIGPAWERFQLAAKAMSQRIVSEKETVMFLLDVYRGIKDEDGVKAQTESEAKSSEKMLKRLQESLFNSPGAHLESARGMLWGVLNAVTHDVDFKAPSRSDDTRLNKAWFGSGEQIKQRAWAKAAAML